MTEKQYDPFAPSDGLLDDFIVSISEASFGVNLQLDDTGEKLFLNLVGRTDDSDQPEFDEVFGCGAGWETDGKVIKRADGKLKGFNRNTKYAMLIASAIEAGAGEVLRSRDPKLGPMNAAIWEGLSFHVKRGEHDYGGEIGKKSVLLFDEFKGEGKVAATTTAAAPAASASSNGVPAALKAKLKKLAKESDSLDTFIDAAFGLDGVDGNADAEELVVSGTLYAEAQAA